MTSHLGQTGNSKKCPTDQECSSSFLGQLAKSWTILYYFGKVAVVLVVVTVVVVVVVVVAVEVVVVV